MKSIPLNNTDSVIYQKAEAYSSVPMAAISEEVESLGGLEALAGTSVSVAGDTYTIQAPIVIMETAASLHTASRSAFLRQEQEV